MFRQKSFEPSVSGKLYLVGTPIGNLEDITLRALSVLKSVDRIAAEDTRHTRKLLAHFDIHKPLVSYHEHSRKEREEQIIGWLKEGQAIALVSDAGMPGISDPGQHLVARCLAEGIPVIPIPGANAALSGLVASGLSTGAFYFAGFLPREGKRREEALSSLKGRPETLILYEAPHRMQETLKALAETLGNRRAVLARELTKRHEELIHGSLQELEELCRQEEVKGEITLVVEGFTGEPEEELPWWENLSVASHVQVWMEKGLPSKEAIKKVAEERKMSRREVYRLYHRTST